MAIGEGDIQSVVDIDNVCLCWLRNRATLRMTAKCNVETIANVYTLFSFVLGWDSQRYHDKE